MERRTRQKLNTQIYEEATNWFVESRAGDLDDVGRRELDQWLRRSPEHLAAYLEIAAIWNEGPALDPHGKYDTEALIRQAATEFENVVPLASVDVSGGSETRREERLESRWAKGLAKSGREVSSSSGRERTEGRGLKLFAVAATALVAVVGSLYWWHEVRDPTYTTDIGEQRSFVLTDGSVIELNSRSKVRVHYTEHQRDLELLEGQALFQVAHNSARPFIVSSDGTRVRAVGTQFDVYRKSVGTVVTVVEGRVAVFAGEAGSAVEGSPNSPENPDRANLNGNSKGSAEAVQNDILHAKAGGKDSRSGKDGTSSTLLAAGEQLTVTPQAAERTEHPNIASATAWTQRQLVFESATLAEVAEEFNRYNRRQLVIPDSTLYDFHISGVFSSTDPDSLIRFLRTRPGLQVSESPDRVRISAAK